MWGCPLAEAVAASALFNLPEHRFHQLPPLHVNDPSFLGAELMLYPTSCCRVLQDRVFMMRLSGPVILALAFFSFSTLTVSKLLGLRGLFLPDLSSSSSRFLISLRPPPRRPPDSGAPSNPLCSSAYPWASLAPPAARPRA